MKSERDLRTPFRWAWAFATLAILLVPGWARPQFNTRLLLATGWGVPGHPGFGFGPFSSLAMNEAGEVAFLSTLRSPRSEIRAVVRSSGVNFSVVAFEGLRSPVPKTTYESFSAPSLNNTGMIAFTARLKDDHPSSAVIRVDNTGARALAITEANVPGKPETTFAQFSAPLISAAGNVLFAARSTGREPDSGLFLSTPQGIQPVPVPPEMKLSPNDLLKPVFTGHDAAVFVSSKTSAQAVAEQFFRAAAIKSFEELKPPPAFSEITEILPGRPRSEAVTMLLVLVEGDHVQTEFLRGDPNQAVMFKRPPETALKPFGRIQEQTTGARGNIIFAAAPADQPPDLALYCLCDGQIIRLTSPEEFWPITHVANGKSLSSLVSDSQHTTAFVAPGVDGSDSGAIYVTSVP